MDINTLKEVKTVSGISAVNGRDMLEVANFLVEQILGDEYKVYNNTYSVDIALKSDERELFTIKPSIQGVRIYSYLFENYNWNITSLMDLYHFSTKIKNLALKSQSLLIKLVEYIDFFDNKIEHMREFDSLIVSFYDISFKSLRMVFRIVPITDKKFKNIRFVLKYGTKVLDDTDRLETATFNSHEEVFEFILSVLPPSDIYEDITEAKSIVPFIGKFDPDGISEYITSFIDSSSKYDLATIGMVSYNFSRKDSPKIFLNLSLRPPGQKAPMKITTEFIPPLDHPPIKRKSELVKLLSNFDVISENLKKAQIEIYQLTDQLDVRLKNDFSQNRIQILPRSDNIVEIYALNNFSAPKRISIELRLDQNYQIYFVASMLENSSLQTFTNIDSIIKYINFYFSLKPTVNEAKQIPASIDDDGFPKISKVINILKEFLPDDFRIEREFGSDMATVLYKENEVIRISNYPSNEYYYSLRCILIAMGGGYSTNPYFVIELKNGSSFYAKVKQFRKKLRTLSKLFDKLETFKDTLFDTVIKHLEVNKDGVYDFNIKIIGNLRRSRFKIHFYKNGQRIKGTLHFTIKTSMPVDLNIIEYSIHLPPTDSNSSSSEPSSNDNDHIKFVLETFDERLSFLKMRLGSE